MLRRCELRTAWSRSLSRLALYFTGKGAQKSQAQDQHVGLGSKANADAAKREWHERLIAPSRLRLLTADC